MVEYMVNPVFLTRRRCVGPVLELSALTSYMLLYLICSKSVVETASATMIFAPFSISLLIFFKIGPELAHIFMFDTITLILPVKSEI